MSLTQSQISGLYVALFGRASEGAGNEAWLKSANANNLKLSSVANLMLDTTASKEFFGKSLESNENFIKHIYATLLNKDENTDLGGKAGWVKMLNDTNDRGHVVSEILKAALNPVHAQSADAATRNAHKMLINKIIASNVVADSIKDVPEGDVKITLNSFLKINDAVTATSSAEDIKNAILSNKSNLTLDGAKLDESISKNDKISVISQVTGKSQSEIKKEFPNYDKDYSVTPSPKPLPNPDPKPTIEKVDVKTFLKKTVSHVDENTSFTIEDEAGNIQSNIDKIASNLKYVLSIKFSGSFTLDANKTSVKLLDKISEGKIWLQNATKDHLDLIKSAPVEKFFIDDSKDFTLDIATFVSLKHKIARGDKFTLKDTSANIVKNFDQIKSLIDSVKTLDSSDNGEIKLIKAQYDVIKDLVSQDDKDNNVYKVEEKTGKAAMTPTDVKDGKAFAWEYVNDSTGITYKIQFGKRDAQPENSDIKVDMPDGKFYNGENIIKDYKIKAYKIYEKGGYKVTQEYTPSTSKSGDIVRDKFDEKGALEEKILERSSGEKLTLSYEDGKLSNAVKTDPEYANTDINFEVSKDSENLDYKGTLYLNANSPEHLSILNPHFNYKGKVTVIDSALDTKWTADIGKDEVVYRAYEGRFSDDIRLVSKAAYTTHNNYGVKNFDIPQTLRENANLKKISIDAQTGNLANGSEFGVLDNAQDKITLPSNITELSKAQDGVNLQNIEEKLSTLGVGKAQYFLQNVGENKFNAYMALNTDGKEGYQDGSDTLIEIKDVEYRSNFKQLKDGATSIYNKLTPDFTVPTPSTFQNAVAKDATGGKSKIWEYEASSTKKYQIVFEKEQDENSGFKFADGVFFDKNDKPINATGWQSRAKVYEIDKSTPNVEVIKSLNNNEGGRVIETVTKTYDASGKLIKQTLQDDMYSKNDKTLDVTYENEQVKSAVITSAQYANKTVKFDVGSDNEASLLATKSALTMDLSTPWDLSPRNDVTKGFKGTATITDKALDKKAVANVGDTQTTFKIYENINSDKISLISKAKGNNGSFLNKEEFDIKETLAQNPDAKKITIDAGNKMMQISKGEKIKLPDNITKISKAADGTDSSNLQTDLANLKAGEGAYFLQNVGGNKFDAYLALNTDGVEGYQEDSDTLVKIAGVAYGASFSDVNGGYTTLS